MPRKKTKKLITLDTETYEGLKGALKRIAIYDGEEITYGYTFEDILPKIKEWKKFHDVHIYIHNIEFDLRKIPEIFQKGYIRWGQTKIINNKYVTVATTDFYLHDSFRLLPMSLKKLSEEFDLKNGKLDLWEEVQKIYTDVYTDIVDFLDRCDVDDELYLKYLGYDVLALYELIEKLCDVSGLEFDTLIKCMTTASMSKKIFKYGFKGNQFKHEGMNKTDFEMLCKNKWWTAKKEIIHNYSNKSVNYVDIENYIRESYYGGRTEVFKPHLKPYKNKIVGYHIDVNSLYPSVMINSEFPIGSPVYYTDTFQIEFQFNLWKRKKVGLGFIKAIVYVPECHIPPLPVKKGKLIFTTGYIEGTWTYNELFHSMEKYGVKIIKYIHMIHFTSTFPIFHNLIETFSKIKIEAKESGNLALYTLSKLIMNTSYGWTGMRRDDKTELQDIENFEKYQDRLLYADRELGFIEIESIVKSETIQVQIASYVTSYARLFLLEAFEKLQEQGAEIYYCDTDSIVSNKLLPPEMLHESELSKWDIEGELKEGIFLQPKVYYEQNVKKENIKFKGVTRATQQTFDRDFIVRLYNKLAEGKEDKFPLEENVEMLRSIKFLQKNNIEYNHIEVRDKYMYLKNVQKRFIDYNENYTKPYHIESIEDFYNFDLTPDLTPYKDENGNIFNPIL